MRASRSQITRGGGATQPWCGEAPGSGRHGGLAGEMWLDPAVPQAGWVDAGRGVGLAGDREVDRLIGEEGAHGGIGVKSRKGISGMDRRYGRRISFIERMAERSLSTDRFSAADGMEWVALAGRTHMD
ncbi:hypothetical protein BJV74DRAFT_99287 [Russula compacta]|nr:hypothetical protein BJV74DRAFT_99287 [Russula compacta]